MVYLLTFDEAIKSIILGLLATAESIIKIGGAIIAVIVGINKFWFKKWYAAYKASRTEFRDTVLKKFDKLENEVALIKKEVQTNGGGSLKDAIIEMRADISGIKLSQRVTREISGVSNWESDSNGAVTYVAPSLCEIYGVSAEYIMEYTWVSLLLEKDRERCIKEWKQSIEYGSPYDIELTIKRGDGMYIDINATAIHTKKDGKVINSLGRVKVIRDAYKELI